MTELEAKLNSSLELNLRLQDQLAQVERGRDSLLGFLAEVNKLVRPGVQELDTGKIYEAVKALLPKPEDPQPPTSGRGKRGGKK